MSCGFCCRKPRHKRLVDGLFPEDPQDATPVAAEQDKLLYFGRSSPEQLGRVGAYLAWRLRRSLSKDRRGHVQVALSITEQLVSECDPRRLQLLADSYLDMLHSMLESPITSMQISATESFVSFAEREEDSTPYHRQYDFFIHRFAAMSLVPRDAAQCQDTRRAGLRGLKGVIHKMGQEDGLQLNIWDLDHMNKIIPAFLFSMEPVRGDVQPQFHAELSSLAEDGLTLLVSRAGLANIDSVIKPVLQHFDLGNLWTMQQEFAALVFVTITRTVQPKDRYKVIQAVMVHLDSRAGGACALKQGILDVLSCCVQEVADGSPGPFVLDLFRSLVNHLRTSFESLSSPAADAGQEKALQAALLQATEKFSAVLPDYHKTDIVILIASYLPKEVNGQEQISHPLSENDLNIALVRCVKAVADSYKPISLETTFSDSLFPTLANLLKMDDHVVQLDVLLMWHHLLDHHGNKDKIPFNTSWDSLEALGLTLGKASQQFADRTRGVLYINLHELAQSLPPSLEHHRAFYRLLFLLLLELAQLGVRDMALCLQHLQDHAQGCPGLPSLTRTALHATVAGLLYLTARVSGNQPMQEHIFDVIAKRQSSAPGLLPDHLFAGDSADGPEGGRGEEGITTDLLFQLRELGMLQQTPEPKRGFFASFRGSGRDVTRDGSRRDMLQHQSISLDYGSSGESPLSPEQITFDSLIRSDSGAQEHRFTGTEESASSTTPSFSELVRRSSMQESCLHGVAELINPSSMEASCTSKTESRSAYDMELPSLH